MIKKDKTFYRLSLPEEKGKIMNETKTTLTIKWDNWPSIEVFKKDNNNLIFLKEIKNKK